MKKYLFFILLVTGVMANAQTSTESEETDSQKRMTKFSNAKRHGLSLDVIAGLVFPAFNPRYEYTLNKYSSIGADVNINFDNENGTEIMEKFSFSPFYRQYFFSKEDFGAKGFYGEGFLKLYTYENEYDFYFNNYRETKTESYFETAIGVGIGWKWVSNSGFLIDINGALGRNLGFADDEDKRDFTGRFGINFGWQF
ncbi:DUF3575 domain-containing protein [Aureivirga sp. CE67]|uniref:DUF3575 domain-containing protein n=1 Tax=Aureivirga sp. CE67 TaxID=1788983 RepID=UPI0018CAF64C|nr:DUF3575 domain-containing protein [Aureivirga sp. CE67]